MNHYRLITIADPIPPELSQGLPSSVVAYIRSREGTETTLAVILPAIRDILSLPDDSYIRVFHPRPTRGPGSAGVPGLQDPQSDADWGSISLTLPMGGQAGDRSWTLCRFRYVGPELIIARN